MCSCDKKNGTHGRIPLAPEHILNQVWKRQIHKVVSRINRPKMQFGRSSNVLGTRRAHVWAFICVLSSQLHAHLKKNT